MIRRWSIAWRLAVGLTVGITIIWLGAVAIAAAIMQDALNVTFDETLRQSAFRLLPLAHEVAEPFERGRGPNPNGNPSQPGGPGPDDQLPPIGLVGPDEQYFTYYVLNQSREVVLRAEDAEADLAFPDLPEQGFAEVEGRRLFALTDFRSGYSIVVVERTDHRYQAIGASMATLIWPLAALVPIIIFTIWLSIRIAMRSVSRLSDDIAKRGSRNLQPLSTEGQPVELAPIATAVASLIDRLRAALDAERAFAASSAHELRTPIAGALAQTQQLALELASVPGAKRIAEIESALKHLSQLAERLLQLSRLDAGFATADTATDLLPVLRLVARDFQASTAGARVRLTEDDATRLVVTIDLDAFAIAIRNLVQNALIHGAPDAPVEIVAGPGATLRVANAGPIVPPETLATLAEPFVRGPTAANGSGLGLSIVRSIVDQTGGTLTLRSPATGSTSGFEAILTWPTPAA